MRGVGLGSRPDIDPISSPCFDANDDPDFEPRLSADPVFTSSLEYDPVLVSRLDDDVDNLSCVDDDPDL